jgi:hypothetical protein
MKKSKVCAHPTQRLEFLWMVWAALLIAGSAIPVTAATVSYVNWNSDNVAGRVGTVSGALPGGVTVTYSGEVTFVQLDNNGIYYYTGSSYVNSLVGNTPSTSGMIAIEGNGTTNTIAFSTPVTDPIMLLVSLGSVVVHTSFTFNAPFTILSQGPGWWGGPGTLSNPSGNTLQGIEGDGSIEFVGTYSSISFSTANPDYWSGFTVGVVPIGGAKLPGTATASAVLTNDFVVSATVTDGGYGYTNTPAVRIIGGGGSGAQAVAVVSNEVVVAVNVLDAGHGYTGAPSVVIAPPFVPQPTMGIVAASLLSLTNLAAGTSYQLQFLNGGGWSNLGAAFAAASPVFTQYVSGTAGPNGYRLAATPVPAQAYATAQLDNRFVVGATVTSGGSGYTTIPTVSITGGGGSGAQAVAVLSNGVVFAVNVLDAGYGYTNAPTIGVTAPPPATALWPDVVQAMALDLGSLSPYDNYQLEFAPVLGGVWTNFGLPFTPSATTSTQYVNVRGNAGFFRASYVP